MEGEVALQLGADLDLTTAHRLVGDDLDDSGVAQDHAEFRPEAGEHREHDAQQRQHDGRLAVGAHGFGAD